MEKYGLVKGLQELKGRGITVASLTTDRHPGIKKHMRLHEPDTEHKFDIWHVAKGLKKKLSAECKRASCAPLRDWVGPIVNHLYWCVAISKGDGKLVVAIWKSMLNHVINVHDGHDKPYSRCLHDELPDGKWLMPGTPAYARLVAVATNNLLLRDMEKLSATGQTSSLESYHSLLIKFAPKSVGYTPRTMRARTQLAALHQNENSNRSHAATKDGNGKYKRKNPRAQPGKEVVGLVKTPPTYG
ncbi:hypothetical protein HPB48_022141 [Haemaphysalis longicornis]|uniref:Uncharacterized protein n=1 Tax=Haemaphysalis longicornis TaxID=44386 RepID=A0A9J6FWM2_HAELO|nr:hypothetical protein HPB48_022141 [Haemaphysalis longicornis]